MTSGSQADFAPPQNRYDLAARGFALRIDLEKHNAWKSKQPPRTHEKELLHITGNPLPTAYGAAYRIIEELSSPYYLSEDNKEPKYNPSGDHIQILCERLGDMVKREKHVARPEGRTIVVGDLHGNFNDLWRIIHAWLSDVVDGGPGQNIMFLGDIVDRGPRQLECLLLIMAYKMHYPYQVFIVRGNHEEDQVCYDFQEHMVARGFFEKLPVIGLIDDRILCMHGMLTPELTRGVLKTGWEMEQTLYAGMARLLRWNDPSEDVEHVEPNATRNFGQLLGPHAIEGAIERLHVDFVIRGHQAMTNGVRRFANLPLATVFSSSYYLNTQNFGAVLFVNPVKNEIVPIFIVNHKDSIKTQEEFDEKLREGWKVDDYAVIPDDITVKGEKK
ncbi:unnamed protein product, partial [Mesorhabditis spiculigera]